MPVADIVLEIISKGDTPSAAFNKSTNHDPTDKIMLSYSSRPTCVHLWCEGYVQHLLDNVNTTDLEFSHI